MDKISNNYSEDCNYVDVHGRDVKVYVCENTGNILIPISEVKRTGFNIYHKSHYNKLHVSESQFQKEFHLFMLEAATTYLLQRQTAFKEDILFDCIDRCKKVLTGENSSQPNKSNFQRSHTVVETPDSSLVIKTSSEASPHNLRGFPNKSPSQEFVKTPERHTTDSNLTSPTIRGFPNSSSPKSFKSFENGYAGSEKNFKSKTNPEGKGFENPAERRSSFNVSKENSTPQLRRPLNNYNLNSNQPKPTQSSNVPEQETLPRLPTIQLDKQRHTVLVVHIEKSGVIWVNDVDNSDIIVAIDRRIKETVSTSAEVIGKKVWNKMYLAEDEGYWFRCRVIKFKPLTVFFIDYGNTAEVSKIREVSSDLETIPCQAVKVQLENSETPEDGDKVTLSINRRLETGLVFAEIIPDDAADTTPVAKESATVAAKETEPVIAKLSAPVVAKEPAPVIAKEPAPVIAKEPAPVSRYFTRPDPMCKVQNEQKIMISGTFGGKFVARTRESFQKLKEIEGYIKSLSPEKIDDPQKGQLILCKKDNNFHRGIIIKIESGMMHVKFLDYYETVQVKSELIKNINESLSLEPITYYITPQIKGYVDNEQTNKVFEELVAKRAKATVLLNGNDFDLKLSDGLLSEKISEFKVDSHRTMFKHFTKYEPPVGLGKYTVNVFENVNNLTLASMAEVEGYLNVVIKPTIEGCNFYEPVVGEVCYGIFEGGWSRAVVLEKRKDSYKVKFIDFGNTAENTKEELRELTEDAKNVPALAFSCCLTGLPSSQSPEKLKTLISEQESYDCIVKKLNGDCYEVEIPSVNELL